MFLIEFLSGYLQNVRTPEVLIYLLVMFSLVDTKGVFNATFRPLV